jgi:hypothetical protein
MTIDLVIEGEAAQQAAADLAAIDGLTVSVSRPQGDGPDKELITLAVIASIVGIASGVATVADLIIQWRSRWKAARGAPVEKVVLVVGDRRVLLERLSDDELAALLKQVTDSAD